MAEAFLNPKFLQELDLFVAQNYVEDNTLIAKGPVEEAEIYVKENRKSFIETLNEMLKKFNESQKDKLDDVALYRKANISKQTYSKIRAKDRPSKDSAVCCALALELCISDMDLLLASAGWSLATNSKRDLILRFCFKQSIHDYSHVCEILREKKEKLFRNL